MLDKIKINKTDDVYILDDGIDDGIGCGSINNDGNLYFIDVKKHEALKLPEKYKHTPIVLDHTCGGYQEGLIMVSLLGNIDLQYHHTFSDNAGMWGWIDLNGNEVIPPQYIFATSFYNGRATVCRGSWNIDEHNCYWSDVEQWGIIEKTGKEIVPYIFDIIFYIEGTDRFILCHTGGWENGNNCIYDVKNQKVLVKLDFDNGYMFNECFYSDGCIFFDKHMPNEEIDYIYVYSLIKQKWIVYNEKFKGRELDGQTKIVINKDGGDIILF